jgi:elongation factor G
LTEALLFNGKSTTRLGRVEEGNTIMDWEPERSRRPPPSAPVWLYTDWKKHRINLIDTPVMPTSRLTAAIVCRRRYRHPHRLRRQRRGNSNRKILELAGSLDIPRIIFINKMDRERADFYSVLKEIQETFKVTLTPLQIPIGKEDSFQGVVDLLSGKAFRWEADGSGNMTPVEIPAEMKESYDAYRTKAIDAIAENDEELMMAYLEARNSQPKPWARLEGRFEERNHCSGFLRQRHEKHRDSTADDLLVNSGPSPLDRPATAGFKPERRKKSSVRRRGSTVFRHRVQDHYRPPRRSAEHLPRCIGHGPVRPVVSEYHAGYQGALGASAENFRQGKGSHRPGVLVILSPSPS